MSVVSSATVASWHELNAVLFLAAGADVVNYDIEHKRLQSRNYAHGSHYCS